MPRCALLRRVLLLASSAPLAAQNAAPSAYAFSAQIAPSLLLEWSTDGVRLHARLTNSAGGSGWASVGTNSASAMGGTDALLFEPSGAGGAVSLISMLGHESPARIPASVAAQTLAPDANFSTSATKWTAEFSRLLAAGSYANARALPASGDTTLIVAWGGTSMMSRHASSGVAMGSINFRSGKFSTGSSALRDVHSYVMAAAWGVLAPAAVAILRYGHIVGEQSFEAHEARMTLHGRVLCLAVVATVIGAVLGFLSVPVTAHLSTTHGVVGLLMLLCAVAQACLGCCCLTIKLAPQAHRALGVATMALGAAAIYLGLALNGVASLLTLFFCVLALALAAVALLELRGQLVPLLARCAAALRGPPLPAHAAAADKSTSSPFDAVKPVIVSE